MDMNTDKKSYNEPKTDLRTKKTIRSIKNAFLQLRAHKPVERISVKELADLAEISKATFYLHYHDIYDLSEQMQQEVIQDILTDVTLPTVFSDFSNISNTLYHAFIAHETMIEILFSGTQASVLANTIEVTLKKELLLSLPAHKREEFKRNANLNILLTYQILGGFYTFEKCRKEYGAETVIDVLNNISVL